MNVLSLFDGMAVGYIALKDAGIKIDNYFSCEIDKFANEQTKHNFPEIIQLGDVTKLDLNNLPKIDLLIGGSPCTGFSFIGKGLAFNDPQSKLFFEFVIIKNKLQEINPSMLFLLENVKMKKSNLRIISEYMNIFPVYLNSKDVSAQGRKRYYWTNIKTIKEGLFDELYTDIPSPQKLEITIKHILQPESEVDLKYYLNEKEINRGIEKHKGKVYKTGTRMGNMKFIKSVDLKSNCICTLTIKGDRSMTHIKTEKGIRILTPIELHRLQTIPDYYKWIVPEIEIVKLLGNGWTMKMISHIFKFIR